MSEEERELNFTVVYRGKSWHLKAQTSSTLGELGREIVGLTNVAPHTLRLLLPKRSPLQPMSEQQSEILLKQSGITEGLTLRMMGVSSAEVAVVSQPSTTDQRILGFIEEEKRAIQRSTYSASSLALPKGNYIFCEFRTLDLQGIVLSPSPAMALKIMHRLASDRGIVAIMSKHRWRVGIMTELAPVGYVGVSPKCLLGFNRNRGQEISLRLRTDDLNGFRKYESIKKTLIHELAHMVHDEHDDHFHALDKQLNEEAITLDWTKSHGHKLSRVKFEYDEEEMYDGAGGPPRGYKLGGDVQRARVMDPRAAAAAAALRRLGNGADCSNMAAATKSEPDPDEHETRSSSLGLLSEPDPDEKEKYSKDMPVDLSLGNVKSNAGGVVVVTPVRRPESDPDEVDMMLDTDSGSQEPDPDEASIMHAGKDEPDPDEAITRLGAKDEPDPDESITRLGAKDEPDPDEAVTRLVAKDETDPAEAIFRHAGKNEPDPDEAITTDAGEDEPDPDETDSVTRSADDCDMPTAEKDEPDPDLVNKDPEDVSMDCQEPDPDEMSGSPLKIDVFVNNPLTLQVKSEEPDPDEMDVLPRQGEPDPDAMDVLPTEGALESTEGELKSDAMDILPRQDDSDEITTMNIKGGAFDLIVSSCRMAASKKMKNSTEKDPSTELVSP